MKVRTRLGDCKGAHDQPLFTDQAKFSACLKNCLKARGELSASLERAYYFDKALRLMTP